jgi:hypothetical protein
MWYKDPTDLPAINGEYGTIHTKMYSNVTETILSSKL